MAVRSSMALEDPPAADWPDDFLAFLVGRLDDMVMIVAVLLLECFTWLFTVLQYLYL